jgi:hypothetical protein
VLSQIIWVTGIVIEALLLFRGVYAKLVSRYLNFYIYVLSLFLADGIFYFAPILGHPIADKWNWYSGFVSLFLGVGIVLEVFRHVLAPYPGAEKVARILSYALMGAVLVFIIVYPIVSPNAAAARTLFYRLQRDFLAVQALLLMVIIRVMAYYAIPTGRNLKGMILGYGQMVALTLFGLALRAFRGFAFNSAFNYIQTTAYLAALVIWLIALWSYLPDPVPTPRISGDDDYDRLASRTRGMVDATESHLVKVERL